MEMIQSGLKKSEEFSMMVGMANVSFTETQSALSGPNQQAPASGSVASIAGMLHYRFRTDDKKAWYGQFTFPLMASQGSYLSGGAGMEYYLGKSSSARVVLQDNTTSFTLTPVTRYFLMGGINMAYISYLTETAKKNDTLLELEAGGGVSRRFNKWTLRVQGGIARGVGVATTTMGMKAMIGGIFFLD
jgi:hypothetical protein